MARKKLYYLKTDKVSGISNPMEWMLEDGTPYVGPYHIYKSTGEVYTEMGYIDNVSKPLIPFENATEEDEINISLYNKLTNYEFTKEYETPTPFTPRPTESDYAVGFIERFIICKFNSPLQLVEVSPKIFPNIDPVLYIKQTFEWRIAKLRYVDVQSVIDTNRKTLSFIKQSIPNIERYYTNLAEFSK
ncbi:MAG: hypothetical protein EBZ49_03565 [Proteobacteria bacterium]|nr:hypothetical protein [Pseudomonadota bacterium]